MSSGSEVTPRLNLPLILGSQAQKHLTHNEALMRLDGLVHCAVSSRGMTAPPAGAEQGARYLVADGATGAWSGHDGEMATFAGPSWSFLAPTAGLQVYVLDEALFVHHDGTGWQEWSIPQSADLQVGLLGVNAEAGPTARLAVAADAVAFSHDSETPGTGGIQIKTNKASAAHTASVLLQTGWSGRAEIGLCGDDDLSFKVSADGEAWTTSLKVAGADGRVVAPQGVTIGEPLPDAGDVTIAVSGPKLTLRDPGHTGAMHTGFVNWVDGDGVEKAWCGLGSTGNTRFTFLSHYADGIGFHAYGGNNPIEFIQGVSTVRMRVHANGYVGVHETAPTAPLHVGGAVRVGSSTVAALPSAATLGEGAIIFVSDESAGATLAFSDGANWRRVQDRAIVA